VGDRQVLGRVRLKDEFIISKSVVLGFGERGHTNSTLSRGWGAIANRKKCDWQREREKKVGP